MKTTNAAPAPRPSDEEGPTLLAVVAAAHQVSRTQARRLIEGGGIYINDVRCTNPEARFPCAVKVWGKK